MNKYEVEAVGTIKHTHRFRGLADFYWDMSNSSLAQRYVDRVLPGDSEYLLQVYSISRLASPLTVGF